MVKPMDIPLYFKADVPKLITRDQVNMVVSQFGNRDNQYVSDFLDEIFASAGPIARLNSDALLGIAAVESKWWTSSMWLVFRRVSPKLGAGSSYENGEDAARAFMAHLMGFVRGHDNRLAEWIKLDSGFIEIHEEGKARSVKTVAGLGKKTWSDDPTYKFAVFNAIMGMHHAQPV